MLNYIISGSNNTFKTDESTVTLKYNDIYVEDSTRRASEIEQLEQSILINRYITSKNENYNDLYPFRLYRTFNHDSKEWSIGVTITFMKPHFVDDTHTHNTNVDICEFVGNSAIEVIRKIKEFRPSQQLIDFLEMNN